MSAKQNKFSPAHFPAGTTFTIKNDMLNNIPGGKEKNLFVVKHVIKNGANSYIIETPEPHPGIKGVNITMNIVHVDSIIKRGEAKFKLHDRQSDAEFVKEFSQYFDRFEFVDLSQYNKISCKNYYRTYNVPHLIRFVLATMQMSDLVVDFEKMAKVIESQSFTKIVETKYFSISVINKKRMKKFIKQNVNRFLISTKQAVKQEQEFEEEMYRRDMESDQMFDDDNFDKILDGSDYDRDDVRDVYAELEMESDLDLDISFTELERLQPK